MNFTLRRGASLIEILAVIAILFLLIGLLLVAISGARRSSSRLDDTNRIRQITLSTLDVCSIRNGEMPYLRGRKGSGVPFIEVSETPYPSILHHTWQTSSASIKELRSGGYRNRFFQSPNDPSFDSGAVDNTGHVSYACNAIAFRYRNKLSSSFQDGLSNTMFWSTHYARCGSVGSFDFWNQSVSVHTLDDTYPPGVDRDTWELNTWFPIDRRSTFADEDCGDAIPKAIEGRPPVAYGHSQHKKGSYYYAIMPQFAPSVEKCNPYVPNSFYADGILVAMGDGSVRFLSKSISEATFWAAVTPAGGEILGGDW